MPIDVKESILASTKKILGIDDDYDEFDLDIQTHINSVFSTLFQLGVGPLETFQIEDRETPWSAFIEDKNYITMVKSYMYIKVRLLFDPPTLSFVITALNDQAKEMEWRLSLYAPPAYPTSV